MASATRIRSKRRTKRPVPILYPRHRVDASMADALYALTAGMRRARSAIPEVEPALVCLSVRSAFDLLLSSLDLAPGDEVLVSSVTHPDMFRIIEMHGLKAIAVDIAPETLAPIPAVIDASLTSRTRMILVAHLFGARVDLTYASKVATRNRLLLVEDCAQSLESAFDRGDPRADVSLFSFGFIKTATALGGALAWVRDEALRTKMEERQRRHPRQVRSEYAVKALKCVAVVALRHERLYPIVKMVSSDPTALTKTVAIPDDSAYRQWLRRRPSAGLVAMVRRRIRNFPDDRLRARHAAGRDLAASLPTGIGLPGTGVQRTTHWVFPVLSSKPEQLIDVLNRAGFEATTATTAIRAHAPSPAAHELMSQVVFIPAYPEISNTERKRLASILRSI